jgi:Tfp pilus assembly protein PilF
MKVPYIFNFRRSCSFFMNFFVSIFRLAFVVIVVFTGNFSVQAQTVTGQNHKGTPHEEVQKSMQARDWFNALNQVDQYLINQPRDPQMRFWRARLLEQLNQADEALATYTTLAQDYPELPEVQNNLGVMLAAQGNVDEARIAFEHALRNNPDYATAHENLGDIFLHLAQRSYDNASRLDGRNKNLSKKISTLQPVLELTKPTP